MTENGQYKYMKAVADKYYHAFLLQGHATAGNNGPHGHVDSPVRNTSHFLIIYTYLYKSTHEARYLTISKVFASYLCSEQAKSQSGAIECMLTDKFDHLNGLIGQAWAIEALLYFYEVEKDIEVLQAAKGIFYSQKYDFDLHLWHRVELDGTDIGVDPTYNHHIWLAACASKFLDFEDDSKLREIIVDLLSQGAQRDFRLYKDDVLRHSVLPLEQKSLQSKFKKLIKAILFPFHKWPILNKVDVRRLDSRYLEKAYHIFDMYGFCILEEKFGDLPLFKSKDYTRAKRYAIDIEKYNRSCCIDYAIGHDGTGFNMFSYSYNSPAFEYPYVALCFGVSDNSIIDSLFGIQKVLMYDESQADFTRNNPDIDTFHARTYEIIRYFEMKEKYETSF